MSGAEQEPEENRPPQHQEYQMATWTVIGLAIVLIAGLFGVQTEHQPETTRNYPSRALMPDAQATLLPAPEIDDEYLPCTDCHDAERPINREVRELDDEHDANPLTHGNLWCLHCHDADKVGSLHLADGARVEFEDSWQLCTQCHAEKLPDWRAGVHGKRTGHWRGSKQYRTCVVCHDPHAPAFGTLVPKPPPPRPEEITHRPTAARTAGEDKHGES